MFIVQPNSKRTNCVMASKSRSHLRWASASDALDGVKTKPIKGRKNERGDFRSRGMYCRKCIRKGDAQQKVGIQEVKHWGGGCRRSECYFV